RPQVFNIQALHRHLKATGYIRGKEGEYSFPLLIRCDIRIPENGGAEVFLFGFLFVVIRQGKSIRNHNVFNIVDVPVIAASQIPYLYSERKFTQGVPPAEHVLPVVHICSPFHSPVSWADRTI